MDHDELGPPTDPTTAVTPVERYNAHSFTELFGLLGQFQQQSGPARPTSVDAAETGVQD